MSLTARWQAIRDRWLTNPAFQRWAASVPGLRWVARRRARAVFDLVAGFVYSQVLYACVQLDIFRRVAKKPLTIDALANEVELSPQACEQLAAAAIALRLLEWRGARLVALGPLGAPLVGNTALEGLVLHHSLFYADLADPLALLRGDSRATRMSEYWPYAATDAPRAIDADAAGVYSALMSSTQSLIADEVLHAYRFNQHRCLLDVGGGEGRFLAAIGARYPTLQLVLFDLPAVATRAAQMRSEQGLAQRLRIDGGDFFNDPLPRGADIISLVRVLHDHDDARVLRLLCAVAAALPAGGTVLIAEPLAETPGAEPVGDAYFGFYFLAMGRGKARSVAQVGALLAEAGFTGLRQHSTRMPLQTSVITATKRR